MILNIDIDVVEVNHRGRSVYFGHVHRHVARMGYPHVVLHGRVSGVRHLGRPKNMAGQYLG